MPVAPEKARLDAVESRVAWLEKSLAELDDVVRHLGADLRGMRLELERLREAQAAVEGGVSETGDAGGLKYEVPPHY